MLDDQTEVETTTSEISSKQPQATTETPTQSVSAKSQNHSEKTPDHGQIAETARVHHYMFCMEKHCNDISKEEHNRIKVERNREKLHHSWLGNKAMSFCQQTAMLWPVYIEGEGFYFLLCKKHQTSNSQNKDVKFTVEPCVRIKEQSLKSHLQCSAHQRAVSGELLNRVSSFQHQ